MSIKDELSKNKIKKNNQKNNDLQIIINIDLLIVKKFKNLFSNEYHIMWKNFQNNKYYGIKNKYIVLCDNKELI